MASDFGKDLRDSTDAPIRASMTVAVYSGA